MTRVSYNCSAVLGQYADWDREVAVNPKAATTADSLFSRGLLAEALAVFPHLTRFDYSPHSMWGLDVLVRSSDAILVGTVTKQSCYVSAESKDILTASTLRVDLPLKGGIAVGELVTVALRSGKITFADGKWAQTVTGKHTPIDSQDRVLTFLFDSDVISGEALKSGGQPIKLFYPANAPNGTFKIGRENRLTPLLIQEHADPLVSQTFRGRPVDALIDAVKKLMNRRPLVALR